MCSTLRFQFFIGSLLLFPAALWAGLAEEIINPLAPNGITNANVEVEDFKVTWLGSQFTGLSVSIDQGSVEWVRVRETLVLPRARALVKIDSSDGAELYGPGFVVPLRAKAQTHFPIPLIAADDLVYTIKKNENGQTKEASFKLSYEPREKHLHVFFDASCSRFDLNSKSVHVESSGWIYVGCQIDPMESSDGPAVNLEIQVFWQRSKGEYSIDEIASTNKSVLDPIVIRAAPPPSKELPFESVHLSSQGTKVDINYKLPWKSYRGKFALGLGPYKFDFHQGDHKIERIVLMPTVYGSFAPTSSTRLVFFDATTISKPWTTDAGLYFSYESVKFLDRRVSLQILLGGHIIAFDSHKGYVWRWGGPQGAELIGSDIFMRGYNMAVGGFVFPWIGGKAYNNMWLRYGTKQLFLEFNYIMWREKIDSIPYFSQSLGLTLGAPLDFLSF